MNWNERLFKMVQEQLVAFPVEQHSMFVPWLQTEVGFHLYEVNMLKSGIPLDEVRAEVLFNNILAEVVKTSDMSAHDYERWLCENYEISEQEFELFTKKGLVIKDMENELEV